MKTPPQQSFQDTAKAILKWKFRALKTYFRKKVFKQINSVSTLKKKKKNWKKNKTQNRINEIMKNEVQI